MASVATAAPLPLQSATPTTPMYTAVHRCTPLYTAAHRCHCHNAATATVTPLPLPSAICICHLPYLPLSHRCRCHYCNLEQQPRNSIEGAVVSGIEISRAGWLPIGINSVMLIHPARTVSLSRQATLQRRCRRASLLQQPPADVVGSHLFIAPPSARVEYRFSIAPHWATRVAIIAFSATPATCSSSHTMLLY